MSKMKIIAIGDFHGRIPTFLSKVIKREWPNLIVSQGDFCAFYERKLFFKYSYEKQLPLEWFIGKRKKLKYTKRNIASGRKVINYLKKLNIPIIAVSGNADPARYGDIGYTPRNKRSEIFQKYYLVDAFKKFEDENFRIIDFKVKKFNDYAFIGSHKSSYHGFIPGEKNEYVKSRRRIYKSYKKKLSKLFLKNKKHNIIFLSHNVPYKTLDKLHSKTQFAKRTHFGSFLTREIIQKYQPLLCICGHMHENPGIAKIGKTLVVNPGAACDGRYAIIEIVDSKVKVKLKN